MKKLFQKLLFLALGASFVFLYSCGEDEEVLPAAPSLGVSAVNGSGATVQNGGSIQATDSITFSFTANTPGGFNVLRWTGDVQSGEYSRTDIGAEAGETSPAIPEFVIYTSENNEGGTASILFTLVDDESQSDTLTFTFSITEAPSPVAKIQTAIILAAPLANGTSTSFYSVGENTLYSNQDVVGTAAAISPNIDLAYYYGNTDEASVVSPSIFPAAIFDISAWGTRNETAMVEITDLTEEQFNALETVADVEAILDAYSEVDAFAGYSGLEVGSTIAFETAGGISGIFIVKALTAGFTGSIELEMILAEAAE